MGATPRVATRSSQKWDGLLVHSILAPEPRQGPQRRWEQGDPPHLSLVHPLGSKSPINRLLGSRGIELGDLCPAGTAPSASSLALWGQGLAGWGLQTALWLPW